jgi:hypothetical protein
MKGDSKLNQHSLFFDVCTIQAGQNDGSHFLRPMTRAELAQADGAIE